MISTQISYAYVKKRRDFGKHAAFTAQEADVRTSGDDMQMLLRALGPTGSYAARKKHFMLWSQVLFDLRPNEEYAQEHIERAVNTAGVQVMDAIHASDMRKTDCRQK